MAKRREISADIGDRGQPSSYDEGTADVNVLADRLSAMARVLQASSDTEDMLDEVVKSAVRLIPGADEASISVVTKRRHVTSRLPTGPLPARVDALQEQTGQGPCLDAIYEQKTVRVPDMATDQRWPRFASLAAEAGAASMLSFQLFVEGDNLGALNLFGHEPNAFDDDSEHIGLLFASHAAIAFAGARHADRLQDAVATRDIIGQAKGILMERHKLTPDQAFRVLVRASNETNQPLRVIALQLADTGALPTDR